MGKYDLASRLSIGFCVLLLVVVCTNFGFAQGEDTSQEQELYLMYIIQVNPGMGPSFESVMKNDLIPALKKGDSNGLYAFRTGILGDANTYRLALPMTNITEFDLPNPLVKALGEEGVAALMAKMQPLINNNRSYMLTGRTDLGISPSTDYAIKLAVEATHAVAPGRTEEYEKGLTDALAVIKKTNTKGVITCRVGLGGNPNEYSLLVLFDSFADIEKFGPAFEKAAAEAKLSLQSGVVVHQKMVVWSYAAELSIEPPAQ
jgi:hypothetical protein